MIYNFSEFKLNELKNITSETPDDYNECDVISYKGDYWVINKDNFDENINDINNKLGTNENELHDLLQFIREERPYILFAHITDDTIWVDGYSDFRHSGKSSDLKKLKNELNLPINLIYSMIEDEEEYIEIDTENEKYFHGTSINYLDSILKIGIKPTDKNNFDIEHNDKIFLTNNIEKAYFHAKKSALKNKSFPIILEIKIPDKTKIGLDYDLAIDVFGVDSDEVKELGFDDVFYKSNSIKSLATGTSYKEEGFGDLVNKIGIVSYKGRIPTSHIKYIWFDDENYGTFYNDYIINGEILDEEHYMWSNMNGLDLWSELTPQQLKIRIDRIEEECDDEYAEDDEEFE